MTDSLLTRLAQAKMGSRDLDARIHIALFDPLVITDPGGYGPSDRKPVVREHASKVFTETWDWSPTGAEAVAMQVGAPRYTTSIDEALTLVPDGMAWRLKATNVEGAMEYSGQVNYEKPSDAPTSALALCIAALRAREEERKR